MSKDKEKEVSDDVRNYKERLRNAWDDWLNDMSDREQPDACSVDNPDCEACGS
jgi:hypothetical protein